jgi:hypothetical protein
MACITITPDMMALVVAIEGIILPAIAMHFVKHVYLLVDVFYNLPLISNRLFFSMPKICARKLAADVTKSNASSSSLSNEMAASASFLRSVAILSPSRCALCQY